MIPNYSGKHDLRAADYIRMRCPNCNHYSHFNIQNRQFLATCMNCNFQKTIIMPYVLNTHMGGDEFCYRNWTWGDFLRNFVYWRYEDGVLVSPVSFETSQDKDVDDD